MLKGHYIGYIGINKNNKINFSFFLSGKMQLLEKLILRLQNALYSTGHCWPTTKKQSTFLLSSPYLSPSNWLAGWQNALICLYFTLGEPSLSGLCVFWHEVALSLWILPCFRKWGAKASLCPRVDQCCSGTRSSGVCFSQGDWGKPRSKETARDVQSLMSYLTGYLFFSL